MDREMKERTKTMQEILEQYYRIAISKSEHVSLKKKAFEAYWRYMERIKYNDKHIDMMEHIIGCINGRVTSNENRFYLYPEIGKMRLKEKMEIAGRIADTIVCFTRQEYAGF